MNQDINTNTILMQKSHEEFVNNTAINVLQREFDFEEHDIKVMVNNSVSEHQSEYTLGYNNFKYDTLKSSVNKYLHRLNHTLNESITVTYILNDSRLITCINRINPLMYVINNTDHHENDTITSYMYCNLTEEDLYDMYGKIIKFIDDYIIECNECKFGRFDRKVMMMLKSDNYNFKEELEDGVVKLRAKMSLKKEDMDAQIIIWVNVTSKINPHKYNWNMHETSFRVKVGEDVDHKKHQEMYNKVSYLTTDWENICSLKN